MPSSIVFHELEDDLKVCSFQIWKAYDTDCSGFIEANELQVAWVTTHLCSMRASIPAASDQHTTLKYSTLDSSTILHEYCSGTASINRKVFAVRKFYCFRTFSENTVQYGRHPPVFTTSRRPLRKKLV
jgi:hypothetical protein